MVYVESKFFPLDTFDDSPVDIDLDDIKIIDSSANYLSFTYEDLKFKYYGSYFGYSFAYVDEAEVFKDGIKALHMEVDMSVKKLQSFADKPEKMFAGKDKFVGGASADKICGYAGNDKIKGHAGNDKLWGNAGQDFIDAGKGNDQLFGGKGNDTLIGGPGKDAFVLKQNKGYDTIKDFTSKDSITCIGLTKKKLKIVDKAKDTWLYGKGDLLAVVKGGAGKNLF